jgi:hypothetical protein
LRVERSSPWLHSLGFDLVRASAAGTAIRRRCCSEADLAGTYYAEPDADIAARSLAAKRARFREYQDMISSIPKARPRPRCGLQRGELRELFREAGWSVAGVEASPAGRVRPQKARIHRSWQGSAERRFRRARHLI